MSEQMTLIPTRLMWCETHPRAWAHMLATTRDLVAQGRHFSPRLVFELTRYQSPEWAAGESFALNNNDLADLADALRAEVPGAAELMNDRRRRSA